MPLARIITEHADESLELAMQLRSRGFQVETVLPNQIPEHPVEIEIQLDACDVNDVLARVMEISADDGSYVFVAPGALDEALVQRPGNFVAKTLPGPFAQNAEPIVKKRIVPSGQASSSPIVSPPRASRWFEEPDETSVALPEPVAASPDEVLQANEDRESVAGLDIAIVPAADEIPIHDSQPDDLQPDDLQHHASQSHDSQSYVSPSYDSQSFDSESNAMESAPPRILPGDEHPKSTGSATRSDAMFWRIAIIAAALAASVVVVGSVWQQRRPAPGSLPAPASQRFPFHQPAKVAAPPANVQPTAASGDHGPVQPHPSVPAPIPAAAAPAQENAAQQKPPQKPTTDAVASQGAVPGKPSNPPPVHVASPGYGTVVVPVPVATPPAQPKPNAGVADSHVTKPSNPSKNAQTTLPRHVPQHSGDSGLIAKDTVVYYGKKPANQGPAPNTKQFSDNK